MPSTPPPIVVMGVQGAGKSTIAMLVADRLGLTYIDGDDLHPAENIALMSAGNPLTDEHRIPWLHAVGRVLADRRHEGIVVACSALKRSYRDLLRGYAPDAFVVDPEGSIELISARIRDRDHKFMPPDLLQSQFDVLEPLQPDESGVIVDISLSPAQMVDGIVAKLETVQGNGERPRAD